MDKRCQHTKSQPDCPSCLNERLEALERREKGLELWAWQLASCVERLVHVVDPADTERFKMIRVELRSLASEVEAK